MSPEEEALLARVKGEIEDLHLEQYCFTVMPPPEFITIKLVRRVDVDGNEGVWSVSSEGGSGT